MNRLHTLFLIASSYLLISCSIMGIRKHNPNYKNTREITKVKEKFNIGSITPAPVETSANSRNNRRPINFIEEMLKSNSMNCRAMTFDMPPTLTVSEYIHDAFTSELDAAHMLDVNGRRIDIIIEKLELDTTSLDIGYWNLNFSYSIENQTYKISTVSEFQSAFIGSTACINAANAFADSLADNFVKLFQQIKN